MIVTKAELARRLDALPVGQPLADCWFLLKRLFGRDGQLDAHGVKAARAFAARHNCILSCPEFSREPVLFEKLSADGQLTNELPYTERREAGLRRRADGKLDISGDRRTMNVRRLRRKRMCRGLD